MQQKLSKALLQVHTQPHYDLTVSHNSVAGAVRVCVKQQGSVYGIMIIITRMWANAQPDGRPAEHRWCPLFNAPKFG